MNKESIYLKVKPKILCIKNTGETYYKKTIWLFNRGRLLYIQRGRLCSGHLLRILQWWGKTTKGPRPFFSLSLDSTRTLKVGLSTCPREFFKILDSEIAFPAF
jgi:predicted amidohydrolase